MTIFFTEICIIILSKILTIKILFWLFNKNYMNSLYELPEPFCKECAFARYAVEPVAEIDLLE